MDEIVTPIHMSSLARIQITDQGGGVNAYNRPSEIGANEILSTSRNVRANAEYSRPRGGYITFANTLSGGKIANIGVYRRQVDTNDVLVCVQNNTIYYINPDTGSSWTALTGDTLSSSANISFSGFGDWLFVYNGVDVPQLVAATTVSQPFTKPDAVTTFNPLFGEVYNGVSFVSGVTGFENYVFSSKFATPATPTNIYNFAGGAATYGDGNQYSFPSRVTGIKKMGSALIVFTVDGPWFTTGVTTTQTALSSGTATFVTRFEFQPIIGASGCVNYKTLAVVGDDIFYMTPEREIKSIKRAMTGDFSALTVPLSIKIQPFITEKLDDDVSSSFMVYNDILKEVYLFFKEKDAIYNNICIVGDMNKLNNTGMPEWFIDDNKPWDCGAVWKGRTFFGSSTLGQAYIDNEGYSDDDNSNIITERNSKDFNLNNPTVYKNFREFVWFSEITQLTAVTIDVYVDDVLVATEIVNALDLISQDTTLEGGIATQGISDYAIADEDDDSLSTADLFEVVKRIPLRVRGKKIRYTLRTDGTGNNYNGRFIEIAFIPVNPLVNPLIEK